MSEELFVIKSESLRVSPEKPLHERVDEGEVLSSYTVILDDEMIAVYTPSADLGPAYLTKDTNKKKKALQALIDKGLLDTNFESKIVKVDEIDRQ